MNDSMVSLEIGRLIRLQTVHRGVPWGGLGLAVDYLRLMIISQENPRYYDKVYLFQGRDEPDGSCRESPAPERTRDGRQRHSNASSEISGRSKSSTPVRNLSKSLEFSLELKHNSIQLISS